VVEIKAITDRPNRFYRVYLATLIKNERDLSRLEYLREGEINYGWTRFAFGIIRFYSWTSKLHEEAIDTGAA
jgi:hypothetical protein